jgi:hypothetical protein
MIMDFSHRIRFGDENPVSAGIRVQTPALSLHASAYRQVAHFFKGRVKGFRRIEQRGMLPLV